MEINPWYVESIEAFSYFKCPECPFLSQVKKYFEDHAVKNHILSTVLFGKVIENLNHDDETTSEECDSRIIEWTPKLPNKVEIYASNDSFEDNPTNFNKDLDQSNEMRSHSETLEPRDTFDDNDKTSFEDHITTEKMRVPIIKTEECEPEIKIEEFSLVTNQNMNDDCNENYEEVQKSPNPLTATNTALHYKGYKGKIHRTCGVLSCKNAYVHGGPDKSNVVFHSFPKDKEERKSWVIACMNPKITTKNEKCKKNYVCGKHFTNDCYPGIGTKIKRLKKGSKPTKYLPFLNKDVCIGNKIVGKVVDFESVAIEEPVRPAVPGGAGDSIAPPDFGRSVNPISTKGGKLCPPNNTGTPGSSDLPTALKLVLN